MAEKDDRPDDRDDDTRDDDLDLDDDRDDDDEDGDEGEEFTPPTKEEWDKVRATMRRRKEERDAARAKFRALEDKQRAADRERASRAAGGKDTGGKDTDGDAPDDRDDEGARWRQAAARASAATQLQAAGFQGSAKDAKRLTQLLDLEHAEPDKDGDFDFEDEIDDLKERFGALFEDRDADRARRTRRPSTGDRGRGEEKRATEDPTQRTSRALLRQAGVRRR